MAAFELNPLAAALRDVLQKHEREVEARVQLKVLGEIAPEPEANVSSEDLEAAEQELETHSIALTAAILEYTDQLLDLLDEKRAARRAQMIEENTERRLA